MKKGNSSIEYKKDFLIDVFAYLDNYKVLEIDIDKMYDFSHKEKEVLLKLKKLYSKINLLKDNKTVSLERISNDDMLLMANSFLISIFPKFEKQILELDNLIIFDNFHIDEVGLGYSLRRDGSIRFNKIEIPNNGSNYMVSTIVHKKMHALTFNNIDLKYLFEHNIELLPILLEKMVLCDLDDYYSVILDQLIRINDIKQAFMHIDFMNYLKNNPDKTILDKYVSDYFKVNSYNYLIGHFYTDLLIRYYLEDKDNFVRKLNQVLMNKLSITKFLDSYSVNLLNKNLIPTIKSKTDKCKRITIIP